MHVSSIEQTVTQNLYIGKGGWLSARTREHPHITQILPEVIYGRLAVDLGWYPCRTAGVLCRREGVLFGQGRDPGRFTEPGIVMLKRNREV